LLTIVYLYTQLVIAILGFVAPIVTLLLPVLGDKITIIRTLIKEQERQVEIVKQSIKDQYTTVLNNAPHAEIKKDIDISVGKHIKRSTKSFDSSLSTLKRSLRHCHLKRQIIHIFASLVLALFFIVCYYVLKFQLYLSLDVNENTGRLYRVIAIGLSVIAFAYSIYRLWTLILVVIEHKPNDNSDITMTETIIEDVKTTSTNSK